MSESDKKPSYVMAFRLTDSQLAVLDAVIKAQEIKPSRAQAGYHYFCRGLGVPEEEIHGAGRNPSPRKRNATTKNKTTTTKN
jgi:hypothetical protein